MRPLFITFTLCLLYLMAHQGSCDGQIFTGGSYDGGGSDVAVCGVAFTYSGGSFDGGSADVVTCGVTHVYNGGSYDGTGRMGFNCGLAHVYKGGTYDGQGRDFIICGVTRVFKGGNYDGASGNIVALCGVQKLFKGGSYDGSDMEGFAICGAQKLFRGGSCSGDYMSLWNCQSEIYFTKQCWPLVMLPVELLSFRGECLSDNVLLSWETASEVNNDYFTVSVSADPGNNAPSSWHEIGRVQGAGNSTSLLSYSFIDKPQSHGLSSSTEQVIYYRLSQTDYDGATEFFDPVAVKYPCENNEELMVYPIPAGVQLTILTSSSAEEITILNHLGQIVALVEPTEGKTELDVSGFAPGVYMLTVRTGYQTHYRKIIIAK